MKFFLYDALASFLSTSNLLAFPLLFFSPLNQNALYLCIQILSAAATACDGEEVTPGSGCMSSTTGSGKPTTDSISATVSEHSEQQRDLGAKKDAWLGEHKYQMCCSMSCSV